ncbi:MAG TPA: hypothetical protein PLJ38_02215, partial [bacterium]|nr:hypothetical protein [bacterium]
MKKIIFSIIAVLLLNFSIIAENSKICDNGHKNPANTKFCVFCGLKLSDAMQAEKKAEPPKIKPEPASKAAPLPKKIICNNCGKVYTDQAPKFCTNCGERLAKDRNIEQQPAAQQQQQQQQRQQRATASAETPVTAAATAEQEKTIDTQQTDEKKETITDKSDKKT